MTAHWDGAKWTIDGPSAEQSALAAISCASTSDCWAVGFAYPEINQDKTHIEHWDGRAWSVVPSFDVSNFEFLYGVFCTSSANCWAVGFYRDSFGYYQELVEHWDGSSWNWVRPVNPHTMRDNVLLDVTCLAESDCWAVGYSAEPFGLNKTLVEHWDGAVWSVVSSPNAVATGVGFLQGVSCTSAVNCWAVGFSFESENQFHTLIERWNGTSWEIVPSPDASALKNILSSITCASPFECWAVGYQGDDHDGNVYQTLIEGWNGNSWSLASSPNTSAKLENMLRDITCTASSECWAVGFYDSGPIYQTLIQHYTVTPRIVSLDRLTNGHILLECQGLPNSPYRVQASTALNPAHFATIATVTTDSLGSFSLEDSDAASFPARFYRLLPGSDRN